MFQQTLKLCWPCVRFGISNLNFHLWLLLRKMFLSHDQNFGQYFIKSWILTFVCFWLGLNNINLIFLRFKESFALYPNWQLNSMFSLSAKQWLHPCDYLWAETIICHQFKQWYYTTICIWYQVHIVSQRFWNDLDGFLNYTHWDIVEAIGFSGSKGLSNADYFPFGCWTKRYWSLKGSGKKSGTGEV